MFLAASVARGALMQIPATMDCDTLVSKVKST